jgi:hypothetical protein
MLAVGLFGCRLDRWFHAYQGDCESGTKILKCRGGGCVAGYDYNAGSQVYEKPGYGLGKGFDLSLFPVSVWHVTRICKV